MTLFEDQNIIDSIYIRQSFTAFLRILALEDEKKPQSL